MAGKAKILVVDDEISIIEVLKALLKREGYSVKTASSADEAMAALEKEQFDLMISDIRMRPVDGLELLRLAREVQSHLAVIMMTAYAAVETAVDAMKRGAFDYICKPFKVDELLLTVERALSYEHVLVENETLKETLRTKFHFKNLVGDSERMRRVYSIIEKVARSESTVLILGESGTGKELVAKALHCNSHRAEKPFVAINCAALPGTLLESELFGYVKGAFTGANKFKKGLFESATGGTLFLDEVGSIPINMQLTLLRVLQEHEIRPVGATESVNVDVRIIAATNENLENLIKTGQFREDLYYRLSVIPVELPPLRERLGDIPLLVNHFLEQIRSQEDRTVSISGTALQLLQHSPWPGNVRELENVISRAAALCDDSTIDVEDLPEKMQTAAPQAASAAGVGEGFADLGSVSLKAFLRSRERDYIQHVLDKCDGNKETAAKELGISLATFYRKYGDA
ncbi:MAG: sigma-54-dependent Fis family transcriptional regulator [Lentisphaerae bacterium]|jgi:two-component system, NtrC family, response regulator PilR|nr:sigma-54-dependent Fis family transcriptional regulator [Lentisphaerota bacterium]MBT4822909.1 sigma-54-dependent Fis family transcriptional regulator [Lentisphaerota bacterium]MBT5609758.1 sigma-54-dependent Fis family transcriptional regulator [Lentisphaerota bacterium]MBT7061400.1 sigma-54-dependent Fis family transcriptional regulator [Lentisphaerota bacterium]MBT7845090.1 sigma-54-dependent Fis family transcriptional regulator [Lentisphaerota bacterium]